MRAFFAAIRNRFIRFGRMIGRLFMGKQARLESKYHENAETAQNKVNDLALVMVNIDNQRQHDADSPNLAKETTQELTKILKDMKERFSVVMALPGKDMRIKELATLVSEQDSALAGLDMVLNLVKLGYDNMMPAAATMAQAA